jgi:hypothetical protein
MYQLFKYINFEVSSDRVTKYTYQHHQLINNNNNTF